MNERIQQLAQEAGMYVDLNGNPWPKWMSAEECEVAYKKFAELIVRECASQVRFTDLLKCNDDSDGEILLQASVQLKQHFGVEE
jgi:hypothetical protein